MLTHRAKLELSISGIQGMSRRLKGREPAHNGAASVAEGDLLSLVATKALRRPEKRHIRGTKPAVARHSAAWISRQAAIFTVTKDCAKPPSGRCMARGTNCRITKFFGGRNDYVRVGVRTMPAPERMSRGQGDEGLQGRPRIGCGLWNAYGEQRRSAAFAARWLKISLSPPHPILTLCSPVSASI